MQTLVCRTGGCSLVRLGVSREQAATYRHDGEDYRYHTTGVQTRRRCDGR